MAFLRTCPFSHCYCNFLAGIGRKLPPPLFFSNSRKIHPRYHHQPILVAVPIRQNGVAAAAAPDTQSASFSSSSSYSPLSGLEDVLLSYISGKAKATEVAHRVWKHVVHKGDTLVDATCGNGHDTLKMVKLVVDRSLKGRVYAMDIQKDALEMTSSMLDASLDPDEKEIVKLSSICHSRMEEVIPNGTSVRLVAFNLGYLPGGDKTVITSSETTSLALGAAERMLTPGGLISLIVYVGHPGGREEFETVQAFAAGLAVDSWTCCKLEMLNRPLAPILVFLFKSYY